MTRAILVAAVALMLTCGSIAAVAQTTIETDGEVKAQGFDGDGSKLTNVDAATLGGNASSEFAGATETAAVIAALQAQVDALGLALVPRTGQTTCYNAEGAPVRCGAFIGLAQDGDLQLGVTWPNPRFTDNGDGTVTDNLTGLIWLEDADCFGDKTWADALAAANGLFDGSTNDPSSGDCGLSDSSTLGAWRLPNVRELQSLVHYGVSSPAVPNTAGTGQWVEGGPFSGVQSLPYWSSTTLASGTDKAWAVDMNGGYVSIGNKSNNSYYVWPVRGGQ